MAVEPEAIAVDADVLMNLLATECATEILRALNLVLLTPPTVAAELLYLESREPGGQREQIDLTRLDEDGVLSRVELDDSEVQLLIQFARLVDDGEAEVLAVALNRNVRMATDDRKARRVASEQGLALYSTPEFLNTWQSRAAIPSARLSQVLGLVGRRSHFRPAATHQLYEWWISLLEVPHS